MKTHQFNALAKLARQDPHSKGTQGARLVLVEGAKQGTAALAVGCSQATISQAVRRIKEARRLSLNSL